jgi:uncharacterized protein (DUF1330 family)
MFRCQTISLALAVLSIPMFALGADAPKPQRVFELRTYHTHPGRLDALNKRFREHTNRLFQKHGMELIGYWTPQDEAKGKADTLVYILAFPSREAAAASWKAFQADPEWHAARDASEQDGKIVAKVESVFLDPTDYSALK